MKTITILSAVVCSMCMVSVTNAASLPDLVKQAATNDGVRYLAVRNEIVAMGTNALPELCDLAVAKEYPWEVHLIARICIERISSSNRIEALRQKEWEKDSEYDKSWNGYLSGPTGHMSPLVVKRFKEEGFWYYYAEINWKNTEEGPLYQRLGNRLIEAWPSYAKQGVGGEPEFVYYVKGVIDRLLKDPQLVDPGNVRKYEILYGERIMDAAPTLLLLSEAYSLATAANKHQKDLNECRERQNNIVEKIISFSRPDTSSEIDKYLDANPRLAGLKPKVEELKARKEANLPLKEPAFRLGQKPIEEIFSFAK